MRNAIENRVNRNVVARRQDSRFIVRIQRTLDHCAAHLAALGLALLSIKQRFGVKQTPPFGATGMQGMPGSWPTTALCPATRPATYRTRKS